MCDVMKKILVLSDTHSSPLPKEVFEQAKNVDGILHAGDFTDIEVFQQLKKINKIFAVYGNMDEVGLCEMLPQTLVVEFEGVRIGLLHGQGAPHQVAMFAKETFKKEKLQAIVFGHSHIAMNDIQDGILMFNPGSSTDSTRAPFLSYGILEIKDGHVKGRIVKIKA